MPTVMLSGHRWTVARSGQGPPLMLVHGFPLDHSMWQGQLDGLAGVANVIAPDLAGFGASQGGTDGLSMAGLARNLIGLLDAWGIQQPITLCGLSMGGYVALECVDRYPERIDRLVLCDTRAAADSPREREARFETAERVGREGSGFLAEAMAGKLFSRHSRQSEAARVESMGRVMRNTSPLTIAAALRAMAERRDLSRRIAHIQQPTLVLCGREDTITPPREMQELTGALPRGTFHVVEEAGHLAPYEQPDSVNGLLKQWLPN